MKNGLLIVIVGHAGTGKTHTAQMFKALALHWGYRKVSVIDENHDFRADEVLDTQKLISKVRRGEIVIVTGRLAKAGNARGVSMLIEYADYVFEVKKARPFIPRDVTVRHRPDGGFTLERTVRKGQK